MACPNMLSIGKIKFIFNLHNIKTFVYVDTEEAACHRCYYKKLFQKYPANLQNIIYVEMRFY